MHRLPYSVVLSDLIEPTPTGHRSPSGSGLSPRAALIRLIWVKLPIFSGNLITHLTRFPLPKDIREHD